MSPRNQRGRVHRPIIHSFEELDKLFTENEQIELQTDEDREAAADLQHTYEDPD